MTIGHMVINGVVYEVQALSFKAGGVAYQPRAMRPVGVISHGVEYAIDCCDAPVAESLDDDPSFAAFCNTLRRES